MVTKFKIFEGSESQNNLTDEPKKGEYLIFKMDGVDGIQFVRVISDAKNSKTSNTVYFSTEYIYDRIFSDIYYETHLSHFYHSSGRSCNILWRSYNKDGSVEFFEMFNSTENYNL